ncbi:MAG TPA: CerR family C-terminal domain-containing protein [Steroidobacteraceae bacterium]|nr:CerR family C-terminal domain-containing protein [Steroidobacteraceae bacterium]
MTTNVAKHRHSVHGGYPRGEETRARIIAAAMQLFGAKGFEGASTRDIAAAAGVNAPALQYYFDSKEGVFRACIEFIAERAWESLSESVVAAEGLVAGRAGVEALIEAYCDLQTRATEFKFKAQTEDGWRLFIARQQAGLDPDIGFEAVFRRISRRTFAVAAAIIAQLMGREAEDEEAGVRAFALSGQFQVFHVCRRTALALLDWREIDADRQELVKRLVRDQTRAVLSGLAAQKHAAAATAGTSAKGAQAPGAGAKLTPSKRPRPRKYIGR